MEELKKYLEKRADMCENASFSPMASREMSANLKGKAEAFREIIEYILRMGSRRERRIKND